MMRANLTSGPVAVSESPMSREDLFLSQLEVIERVIGWVCARRGLRNADAEDFASVVKSRLIENDYQILAKFGGRSSLKTYLAAVVNRLYLDFQVHRFGKWRPSAEARRLGPVALTLERLMFRDGLGFGEACSVMESDPRVTESRDALYALSQRLPHRAATDPRRDTLDPTRPDSAFVAERAERQALAERTFAAIRRSLGTLPARDRLFLRLHLESELSVAEVARSLGLEQKALYRRKEDVLKRLRADLAAEGIGSADAQELLATLDWDAVLHIEEPAGDSAGEQTVSRPSQGHGAAPPRHGAP